MSITNYIKNTKLSFRNDFFIMRYFTTNPNSVSKDNCGFEGCKQTNQCNGENIAKISSEVSNAFIARDHGRCWNCGGSVSDLFQFNSTNIRQSFFCPNCGSLLPIPKGTNYFTFFGMLPNEKHSSICSSSLYNIDLCESKKIYNKMQTLLHPDSFSCCRNDEKPSNDNSNLRKEKIKRQIEKEIATEATSFVNQAYNSIKDPIARADYLMKSMVSCHSIQNKNQEEDIPAGKFNVDKSFLFWQMEIREKIDRSKNSETLQSILKDISSRFNKVSADFAGCFCSNDKIGMEKALSTMRFLRQTETEVKSRMFDVM